MAEQKEARQVQVDVSRAVPVFADEVMVVSRIKAKKESEKPNSAVSKEGFIEVIFLDQLSQPPKAISRVVLSKQTAESLHKILLENVNKMDAELKSKKLPPKPEVKEKKADRDQKYLG